jgi:hypothetical protein
MKLPNKTKIQSLLFEPTVWSQKGAREWARKHKFSATGLDLTDNYIRIRQFEPNLFQPNTFRTIEFGRGIKAIVGRPWVKMIGPKTNPHPLPDNDARVLVETIHDDWKLHRAKHIVYGKLAKMKAANKLTAAISHRRFSSLVNAATKTYHKMAHVKKSVKPFSEKSKKQANVLLQREFLRYWRAGQLDHYLPQGAWSRRQEK